jgi:aspartyl-tRNA(Asn)/glutamyl-tRNA(Gln) amidotransferase subunit B
MAYETYEPVIGLEVHVQLQTDSKIFSPDGAAFGAEPNTQVDPVSLGHPGTLPVLNEKVVSYALRLGLATHCSIADRSVFARKHYFYPDLPKGYQISQYDTPICYDGFVEIYPEEDEDADPTGAESKRIGLTRIHLEEDAGKSIHDDDQTRLDFNRCGVPLLEMVTEPDLRSPHEAYLFLKRLRQLVRYLGISDGNMEEGSLRCDANVSVRPRGREQFGTRTELKNMNSMRHVEQALDYEIARQTAALEKGESVTQQTLLWDPTAGTTRPMRSKEEAHDYRYMPDPDLVEVVIEDEQIREVRAALPELPRERRRRFVDEVGLPPYDARVLTEERPVADYFETALDQLFKRTKGGDTEAQAKQVSNLVMSEVLRVLNERSVEIADLPVGPERLAQLAFLRVQDKVSSNGAQEIFEAMMEHPDASAGKIADERDLIQVSDRDAIGPVVEEVLDDNPEQVETYLDGKEGLFGFFIGQVRRTFDGSPDPEVIQEVLREKLEARRQSAQ